MLNWMGHVARAQKGWTAKGRAEEKSVTKEEERQTKAKLIKFYDLGKTEAERRREKKRNSHRCGHISDRRFKTKR